VSKALDRRGVTLPVGNSSRKFSCVRTADADPAAQGRVRLAGYAGCNENFVLLTTGITGVLSFEL